MMQPINWRMISHPMNWIVVLLMLVIAGTAGHLVLSFFDHEPATSESTFSNLPAGQSVSIPVTTLS